MHDTENKTLGEMEGGTGLPSAVSFIDTQQQQQQQKRVCSSANG